MSLQSTIGGISALSNGSLYSHIVGQLPDSTLFIQSTNDSGRNGKEKHQVL